MFARHQRWAEAVRRAVRAWGLPIQCADPSAHSPVLTGVVTPAGVDADALRKLIHDRFDLSLGTGLGKVKGRMFRIGHLGDINDLTLMAALAGVEMGLKLAGVAIAGSGVQAAMDFFASHRAAIAAGRRLRFDSHFPRRPPDQRRSVLKAAPDPPPPLLRTRCASSAPPHACPFRTPHSHLEPTGSPLPHPPPLPYLTSHHRSPTSQLLPPPPSSPNLLILPTSPLSSHPPLLPLSLPSPPPPLPPPSLNIPPKPISLPPTPPPLTLLPFFPSLRPRSPVTSPSRMDTYGAEDGGGSTEKFAQFIHTEIAKWAKVVKEDRLKVDS